MSIPKLVSQKTIFKGGLIEVREEEIELPNGKKKVHHNVYRVPTVSVFPITDLKEVCLVSQYRYLYKRVSLEAMSGFINTGENPLTAGKRELQEETGLTAKKWEKLGEIELAGSVFKSTVYLFSVKGLSQGKTSFDDDEDIELVKLPLDEATAKVLSGDINHAASVIGILMLDKMKREGML